MALPSQSNGAFRLQSKLGKGTRAEIWLPRAAELRKRRDPRRAEDGEELSASQPLKILLVDDHDEVRATTAAMLEELGHSGHRGRQRRRGAGRSSRTARPAGTS